MQNRCSCLCHGCEGNSCTCGPLNCPIILAASGMWDNGTEMKAKIGKPNLGHGRQLMTSGKLPTKKAQSWNKNKWDGILADETCMRVRILPLQFGRRILHPLSWLEQPIKKKKKRIIIPSLLSSFNNFWWAWKQNLLVLVKHAMCQETLMCLYWIQRYAACDFDGAIWWCSV